MPGKFLDIARRCCQEKLHGRQSFTFFVRAGQKTERNQLPMVSASVARFYVGMIALVLVFVQILPVLRGGILYDLTFLGSHIAATLSIVFIVYGWRKKRDSDEPVPLVDVVLALVALGSAAYFVAQGERAHYRIDMVAPVFTSDLVFGSILILLLLEATRRATGLVLAVLGAICIAFLFLGPALPYPFAHQGLSFERFIDLQLLTTQGIFSTPISASAHMVFYFILVGAFLKGSGAGQLFVDTAYFFTARTWGGPAKASVVSSGLFGMISGSAIANVLISGVMTIPLMKRTGFSTRMAGSLEATSSTGGQLAPPIMGAAAFIMADILGVPYPEVVLAAIGPAILYYVAIFLVVDTYARRNGIGPDRSLSIANFWHGIMARWHLFLPLAIMITLLMQYFSLRLTGLATVLAIITIGYARKATRMSLVHIYRSMVSGVLSVVEVAIPSACAGIIVGTVVYTGMSLRLQRFLLDLAGDSLLLALIGTMFLTILFGLGMPTSAAYLVSAILVAPALQELGVPAMAAHLFILYFGVLSMVTPPVGLASYAAAGLSGDSLWGTGLKAFSIAIPGFLIPYAFVYDQGIIFQGEIRNIIYSYGSVVAGVAALATSLGGYLFGPLVWPLRIILFCVGPALIVPEGSTDMIGGTVILLILAWQLWRYTYSRTARSNSTSQTSVAADRERP